MKMYQIVEWFQINYPELHNDLLQCNHNFDETDLNPYHLESDCWSHTMLVCKIAELYNYDKVVQIAALLHDISKPNSRKINPINNHVQFFGHEELSALMSEDVLCLMVQENIISKEEQIEIRELVLMHGFFHQDLNEKELSKHFMHRKSFYVYLVQLSRCDSLGRFCPDNRFSDERYDKLMSYANEYR
ncbi:MAG: HD domain-containing protein [Sulfurovum sp.]|nr:HD domain-containing protein [Sulfurovum sp.]